MVNEPLQRGPAPGDAVIRRSLRRCKGFDLCVCRRLGFVAGDRPASRRRGVGFAFQQRLELPKTALPPRRLPRTKGDREKIKPEAPGRLAGSQDVRRRRRPKRRIATQAKQPPAKADRDGKKPPVAKVQPAPEKHPAAQDRAGEQAAARGQGRSRRQETARCESCAGTRADSRRQTETRDGASSGGQTRPGGEEAGCRQIAARAQDASAQGEARNQTAPRQAEMARARGAAPRQSTWHRRTTSRRARADVRHNVARGNDAEVMRARKAWLRALAHKYGFSRLVTLR